MKNLFLLLALFTLFSGCSSKKYFEPAKIDREVAYSSTLQSTLKDVVRDGATYANGQVISRDGGLLDVVIPKGFHFVNASQGNVIVTSGSGEVKVIGASGVAFEKTFSTELAGATLKDNLLALIFSDNQIMLYDIATDKMVYKEPLSRAVALDARVANPLFLNDLVVFPTLDGRLLIMDSTKKIVLRDVAISNKALFNNVIFLGVENNILIAATSSKIISINPKSINNKNMDVKDIIYKNSKVYVFRKSGRITMLDDSLKKLNEIKLPYAIFSAVFDNDKLYAVEKKGYLIEIENDLSSYRVYKLPQEIESSLFAQGKRIYFSDKYIDIQ